MRQVYIGHLLLKDLRVRFLHLICSNGLDNDYSFCLWGLNLILLGGGLSYSPLERSSAMENACIKKQLISESRQNTPSQFNTIVLNKENDFSEELITEILQTEAICCLLLPWKLWCLWVFSIETSRVSLYH